MNSGTVSPANPTTYNVETATFSLTNPTRTGYTFAGWTGSNGNTASTSVSIAKGSTGNKSYTANWTARTYTVVFNANKPGTTNVTIGQSNITATFDQAIKSSALTSASANGYTFNGWYTAASGGTLVTNTSKNLVSAPATDGTSVANVYAQWTVRTYDVVFNANTPGTTTVTIGQAKLEDVNFDAAIKSSALTSASAPGYTFNGWYTAASGGTKISNTTTNLVSAPAADGTSVANVYAQWSIVTYTISYTMNGGTNNSSNPSSYTYEDDAITLAAPTRTGYNFAGWTGSNGTTAQTSVTIANHSTGNKSYTANWSPVTYNITYNLNGTTDYPASNNASNPSTYNIETETITLATPTRDGYDFAGWYSNSGLTTAASTITKGSTGNKTFYAKWTANTVTVTISGAGSGIKVGLYQSGTAVTTLTASSTTVSFSPVKNGTYQVWASASVASTGTMFNTGKTITVAADSSSAYAQTISYYALTVSKNTGIASVTGAGTYLQGYTSVKVTATASAGYTFSNWTSNDITDLDGTFTMPAKAVTITANATPNPNTKYTVQTYKMNTDGSTYTMTSEEKTGTTATNATYTAPSYTGFTYDSDNANNVTTGTIAGNGSLVLKVYYTRNQYTLSFSGNNPNSTTTDITVPSNKTLYYEQAYGTLTDGTKTGYTFNGWYTAASGGSQVSSATTMAASNTTIHAHWTAKTYTVTFNSNNGTTASPASKTVTYDSTYGTLATTSRTGYTFAGWWTAASGGSQVVSSTTVKITAAQTLYAHWTENDYSIVFNSNDSGKTGAVSGMPSKKTGILYTAEVGTLGTPTKAGWTFGGWYTNTACTGDAVTSTSKGLSNTDGAEVTLYAKWTAKSLTVNVNVYLNNVNGSGYTLDTSKATSVSGNTGTTVSYTAPAITGFSYSQEATDATDNNTSAVTVSSTGVSGTVHGDATLVFNIYYTRNQYEVTVNNGNTTAVKSVTGAGTYYYGATVTVGYTMNTGYHFTNWTSSDVTVSSNKFTMPAKAVTVTANGTANTYTVGFNANKPSNATGTVTIGQSTLTGVVYDQQIKSSALTNATLTGWTFNGWFTATSGGTQVTNTSKNLTTNNGGTVNLYAQWTANTYTIAYDYAGGTAGSSKPTSGTYDSVVSISNPTRAGYTFAGWTSSTSAGLNTDTAKVTDTATSWNGASTKATKFYNLRAASGTVTLTATWTANTYTVTFNKNADDATAADPATKTVTYDNTYGTLATTSRTGYTFAGWWTAASGGTQVTSSTTVKITAAQTLYAHWTEHTYTVTFNINNSGTGTVTTAVPSNITGIKYTAAISSTALGSPAKNGWTFTGWNTQADGNGTTVTNTNTKLTATNNGTVTLYAQWTANTATAYKVEHYWQNLASSNTTVSQAFTYNSNSIGSLSIAYKATASTYTLHETENKTGTTGATATASSKTYTGFTYSSSVSGTVTSGNIHGDGTLVLKLYYTRNTYNVTAAAYHSSSAATPTGGKVQAVPYGSSVTISASASTGYTNNGYFPVNTTTGTLTTGNATISSMGTSAVKYTFKFTANTYTIAYDYASGTAGTNKPTSGTYNAAVSISNPTRTGYTFAGWTSSSSDGLNTSTAKHTNTSTAWNGSATKATTFYNLRAASGTVTLTATWTENTYTVTFNINNSGTGTVTTAVPSNITGIKYTAAISSSALGSPAKNGWTFKSWNTKSDGSGTTVTNASTKLTATNGGTVTLYAQWTANTATAYKIEHYQMDVDGSGYTVATTENKTGTTDTTATATAKSYTGFTYSSSVSGTVTSGTINGNGTLVLKLYYTRNQYDITVAKGTGISSVTATFGTTTGTTLENIYYGASVTITATVSTGYTWSKWTSNNTSSVATSTTRNYTFNLGAGDVTLTASATANTYTIEYDFAGGTAGTYAPTSATYGQTVTISNPTRTGHTFVGWISSADDGLNTTTAMAGSAYWDGATPTTETTFKNLTATNGGTVILTAVGTINQYTVTMAVNKSNSTTEDAPGTAKVNSSATATVNYNTNVTLTYTQNTGYTFVGYFTTATGGTALSDADTSTSGFQYKVGAANVTIYARFSMNSYTIKYNAGSGATGTAYSVTGKTYEDTITILNYNDSNLNYSKTGYSFAGWSTSSSDTTTEFTYSGTAMSMGTFISTAGATLLTSGSTINLYGVWTINSYKIELIFKIDGSTANATTVANAGISVDFKVGGTTNSDITSYSKSHTYGTSYQITDVSYDSARFTVSYDSAEKTLGASNASLTITFTTKTYTVSFVMNPTSDYGSLSATSVTTVKWGSIITVDSNKITVKSTTVTATPATNTAAFTYAFDGWTGLPTGNKVVGDVTITANFTRTANSYTVTYDATTNGGTFGNASGYTTTATVAYGSSVDMSTSHRYGTKSSTYGAWTFVGWSTSSTATSATSSYTMPAQNVTLYAIYKLTMTASFYQAGSTSATTVSTTIYNKATTGTITTPTITTQSGWTIAGWSSTSGATNANSVVGSNSSMTLSSAAAAQTRYAVYSKTITASYNANSGSGTTTASTGTAYLAANKTATATSTAASITLASCGFTAPSGWTSFYRWAQGSASGTTKTAGSTVSLSADTTFYAVWQKTLTATFWQVDGTTDTDTVTVTTQSTSGTITSPALDTVSGMTKVGWGTTTTDTTSDLAASTDKSISSNVTYYAIYKYTVTISYNANGGSGTTTASTGTAYRTANKTTYSTTNASITLASNNFTYSGWTFHKWAAGSASGTQYAAGASRSVSSNATYYAVWKKTLTATFWQVDGTKDTDTVVVYNTASQTPSGTITSPALDTVSGMTKVGWGTTMTATTSSLAESTDKSISSNVTYYAIYKYTVTISYNANGGSGTTTASTGTAYRTANTTTYSTTNASITLASSNFTYSGWTFYKWAQGSANETTIIYNEGVKVSLNSNTTFYAIWSKVLTASFYQVGTTTATTRTVTVTTQNTSGTVTSPAITSNSSYGTIVGWGTSTTDTTKDVASGANVSITADVTYYAIYSYEFTVSFNGNGHTGGSTASITVTGYRTANKTTSYYTSLVTVVLPSNSFTRTGYTFSKWTEGSTTGTEYDVGFVRFLSSNTTYYAKWTANPYTVTLSANDATNYSSAWSNTSGWTTSSSAKTATKSITYFNVYGTLPTPSRTGHTFKGWFTAESGGSQVTSTSFMLTTSAHTLYAQWEIVKYEITYNLDGGSVSTANPTEYYVTSSAITLNNPTKTGYTFAGWTGTGLSSATTTVTIAAGSTGNRSYTANYTKNSYTLTVSADDATNYSSAWTNISGWTYLNSTKSASKSVAYNDAYGTLPTPTRTGYTFNGWYTASSGGSKVSTATKMGAGNTTIYAQWSAIKYEIIYNLDGGSVSTANPTEYYITSSAITLNNPTKTGYTFNGWTGSNGATASTSVTIAAGSTGDKAYTANWTANRYAITLNPNSGSVALTYSDNSTKSSTTSTVTVYAQYNSTTLYKAATGSVTVSTITTTRTGYTHNGYYTASSGGTKKINASTTATLSSVHITTSTATWYAQWTGYSYTVNYYNGSTKIGSSSHTYGTAKNLTTWATLGGSISGYSFYGWTTSTSSTTRSYSDGASVTNLTSTSGGTVTLYAIGKATVTLSYSTSYGTAPSSQTTTRYYNTKGTYSQISFTLAAAPSASGWSFNNWTINGNTYNAGGTFTNTSATLSFNATANWTANTKTLTIVKQVNYAGSIDSSTNGGSISVTQNSATVTGATSGATTAYSVNVTSAVTLAATNSTGYTFAGWFSSESGTTATSISTIYAPTITSDTTLYARWTANNYTITAYTYTSYGSGTASTPNSTTLNLNVGGTSTATFGSYFLSANGGTVSITANTYMTTSSGSGSSSTVTATIARTGSVTLKATAKTGYTFVGWFTSTSATTATSTSATLTLSGVTAAATRYARFTANTYNLTINYNGGTNSNQTVSGLIYGVYYDIASIWGTPTRSGYVALGLSTSSSATTATYTASTKVFNVSSTNNSSTTLYVVWKQAAFTVSASKDGTAVSSSVISPSFDTLHEAIIAILSKATSIDQVTITINDAATDIAMEATYTIPAGLKLYITGNKAITRNGAYRFEVYGELHIYGPHFTLTQAGELIRVKDGGVLELTSTGNDQTIQGSNMPTNNTNYIIYGEAGGSVSAQYITFKNLTGAGVIYSEGSLTVNYCTFENNSGENITVSTTASSVNVSGYSVLVSDEELERRLKEEQEKGEDIDIDLV